MRIEKFTKDKNGMYVITTENNKIKVHEDLILKYNLLLSKTLDEDIVEKIIKENHIYEIYDIAVKYLNKRLRSKVELIKFLTNKGFSDDNIQSVLEVLTSQGYLDDSIYASSFIHDRIIMSNYGPNKIKGELENLGIDPAVIEDKIQIFTEDIEKNRIEKIIDKQIKTNHNKGAILLKKKIQSFLFNLGYSSIYVNQALNGRNFHDKEAYEKEYNKLLKQLEKKYTGKELEYKLKQKLFQKGFINSDFE